MSEQEDNTKPPLYSIAAIGCPPVMLAVLYFLTTQQGRSFNERVFGRYYTLGALLMLGVYGAFFLGVFALGVGATVVARRRRESPSWMPNVALAANLAIPVGIFLYRSYFR